MLDTIAFAQGIQRSRDWLRIAGDRLRVLAYRGVGAHGIHGKCLIGPRTRIDRPYRLNMSERCVLQSDVWFNILSESAHMHVGAFTFFGKGTQIEVSKEVRIGRGVLIGPNVYVTDHNHDIDHVSLIFQKPCINAPVYIGDDVWIGAKAIVLPGVTIGHGAVIGAGAVVSRDINPRAIAVGIPAREIRYR